MSCQWPNKHQHPDKAAAVGHINALWASGKGSPDMSPYPCPGSKPTHWHVGHDRKKFTARIHRALNPKPVARRRKR